MEKGGQGAEMAPGNRCPRQRYRFATKEEGIIAVVDEGEAEGGGKEIEVGIVPREGNKGHEEEEAE